MVFLWSLNDGKSPQVFRTLLSILTDMNNAVVWIISTHPVISKSFCPCTNTFVTVPRAHITICIIITFMFHSFFNSLARSKSLSLFSHSFNFIPWSTGTAKSTSLQVLFFFFFSFLLIIKRSGHLAEIRWSVCIEKPQRSLCVSFSRSYSGLGIYHLFVWSNLNFWHSSQWITLATLLCLVLYSFCTYLLHSLIMWLIVSSLSPNNLHLLFYCLIYSYFDMVSPYSVILCCYYKRFCFSLKVSFF